MADQGVMPGPPAELQWPPESGEGGPPTARTISGWMKWLIGLGALVVVVALAGTFIRIPYDTLAPGGTLDLEPRISVKGAKTYPARGQLMLLFVRERSHINLWSWLQAKIDPEIDLVKQDDVTGGNSQQLTNANAVCDMSQSQVDARVAALRALGYDVSPLPGLAVTDLSQTLSVTGADKVVRTYQLPAYKVVHPCDEILGVDGRDLKQSDDLSKIVQAHKVGTKVALRISRAGHEQTVQVPVIDVQGRHLIGVTLGRRYRIPVQINVDTNDISGPSAGLAMTLAIIDDLSPGNLTGGKKVAVTGTVDAGGNVGPIGGLAQKAIAARHAGAQVFIVPACASKTDRACLDDLDTAKHRVGKDVVFAPVSTLAQALQVLRDAGGSPVRASAST